MSLDGFIAGPNDSLEVPLGEGGERLHQWVVGLETWRRVHGLAGGTRNADAEVLEETIENLGAVVVGRRMFDLADGWGETPPFHVPVFVVTHRGRETLVKDGGTTFTFITDGIESALSQARAAAGDKDVSVGGGASVIQPCLRAGLLDEIQVHFVPELLGGGRRLFDRLDPEQVKLERTGVIDSPSVTHLRFRVVK